MERHKRDSEIYGITIGGGLDRVGVEDCVLEARRVSVFDIVESSESVSQWQGPCLIVRHDVHQRHQVKHRRPDLTPLFRYHCEAELLIVKLQPDLFAQG